MDESLGYRENCEKSQNRNRLSGVLSSSARKGRLLSNQNSKVKRKIEKIRRKARRISNLVEVRNLTFTKKYGIISKKKLFSSAIKIIDKSKKLWYNKNRIKGVMIQ